MVRELSIVMPVLNEAGGIDAHLAALQPLRERGAALLVVDGGSTDDTVPRACKCPARRAAGRGR